MKTRNVLTRFTPMDIYKPTYKMLYHIVRTAQRTVHASRLRLPLAEAASKSPMKKRILSRIPELGSSPSDPSPVRSLSGAGKKALAPFRGRLEPKWRWISPW